MVDVDFSKIIVLLMPFVPNNWEKIIFMVYYFDGGYEMKFYVKNSNGVYSDYHDLIKSKATLFQLFQEINKIIRKTRNELSNNHLWHTMTIVYQSNNQFCADFDYQDAGDDLVSYIGRWKEKYLI